MVNIVVGHRHCRHRRHRRGRRQCRRCRRCRCRRRLQFFAMFNPTALADILNL